jgi:hypothetical protein
MKKVVIQKPVESVIDLNGVHEGQIIIGYFEGYAKSWHKLSQIYGDFSGMRFQWCGLLDTCDWCSPAVSSITKAVKNFINIKETKNEVYVFDTFDQFLEEFPALVKSKK